MVRLVWWHRQKQPGGKQAERLAPEDGPNFAGLFREWLLVVSLMGKGFRPTIAMTGPPNDMDSSPSPRKGIKK
jgi:hypothetical protein